ncbi:MAG TPA: sigma-70 family RNA polymerase sigma factor [Phenylobacterium sp.]|nr:sigma-70 family RNA polymerase sigma factor [Phenylobacterium sp.]
MAADLEDRLKALMLRGQAGDAAAWRELLALLSVRLRMFFARRLDGGADVEDLVQETLLAVHRRRMTYDPAQPFTAWAHAIAKYKLIDHWRRNRSRRHEPLDDLADFLAAPETEAPETRGDLDRVLAHLPDRQQKLVRDVKLQGLSLAEAGARAGISEGAAKVALHRALKALTEFALKGRDDKERG